jgi:crotonobetainyl-CoA:carnitine CoA-transferase CaiB-like acyl-CoA transferase
VRFLDEICAAAHLPTEPGERAVDVEGSGSLSSVFAVTDLAVASIGAAGVALANLVDPARPPKVTVNRDLASAWFAYSVRPDGWAPPPAWDDVAGDYETADGWIRLHTNTPHHKAAALKVLGTTADRAAVTAAVRTEHADDLEQAVVDAGGCAATMRSIDAWAAHPQGRAVHAEPLLSIERTTHGAPHAPVDPKRPLQHIKVLDLTRVLAGPVSTRLLAGWGAEVLRVDPPGWEEDAIVPEVTLGKRCARLDLRTATGLATFEQLLRGADVFVHGYRGDALANLGLSAEVRDQLRPGLVDVSLDAYGWSGPWRNRRGFDSLVQMSAGIADAPRESSNGPPRPLPVQALDQATGYLMATAVLSGLAFRQRDGRGSRWRASLARTAALLVGGGRTDPNTCISAPDPEPAIEHTVWGPARRLAPPISVAGAPLHWTGAARALGSDPPTWN